MAIVERLYVEPKPESPALKRIRHLSLPFEIIFAALTALGVLLFANIVLAGLFYTGDNFRLTTNGPTIYLGDQNYAEGSVRIADVALSARLVGFVAMLVIQGSLIAAFYCLHRMFNAYRRGVVFDAAPVFWMRTAAYYLIAFAVTPLLLQPIVLGVGLMDRNWFHGHTVASLLVGGSLFVIARVITLGREIEKEGEGYV